MFGYLVLLVYTFFQLKEERMLQHSLTIKRAGTDVAQLRSDILFKRLLAVMLYYEVMSVISQKY